MWLRLMQSYTRVLHTQVLVAVVKVGRPRLQVRTTNKTESAQTLTAVALIKQTKRAVLLTGQLATAISPPAALSTISPFQRGIASLPPHCPLAQAIRSPAFALFKPTACCRRLPPSPFALSRTKLWSAGVRGGSVTG